MPEGGLLVGPGDGQAGRVPGRLGLQPDAEHGVQGAVRVVGREEQGAPALPGGVQGGGGGHLGRRRVAADQDGACRRHAVPPLFLRAAGPQSAVPAAVSSTRFFRPARARSMMTFSALRLIMPSIGILTSTASW